METEAPPSSVFSIKLSANTLGAVYERFKTFVFPAERRNQGVGRGQKRGAPGSSVRLSMMVRGFRTERRFFSRDRPRRAAQASALGSAERGAPSPRAVAGRNARVHAGLISRRVRSSGVAPHLGASGGRQGFFATGRREAAVRSLKPWGGIICTAGTL